MIGPGSRPAPRRGMAPPMMMPPPPQQYGGPPPPPPQFGGGGRLNRRAAASLRRRRRAPMQRPPPAAPCGSAAGGAVLGRRPPSRRLLAAAAAAGRAAAAAAADEKPRYWPSSWTKARGRAPGKTAAAAAWVAPLRASRRRRGPTQVWQLPRLKRPRRGARRTPSSRTRFHRQERAPGASSGRSPPTRPGRPRLVLGLPHGHLRRHR